MRRWTEDGGESSIIRGKYSFKSVSGSIYQICLALERRNEKWIIATVQDMSFSKGEGSGGIRSIDLGKDTFVSDLEKFEALPSVGEKNDRWIIDKLQKSVILSMRTDFYTEDIMKYRRILRETRKNL